MGWVIEYAGPGVAALSVPERATITNMGAEMGVTTSLFPSDEETRRFLEAQGRERAVDAAGCRTRTRSMTAGRRAGSERARADDAPTRTARATSSRCASLRG